jgi:hypothetical protein
LLLKAIAPYREGPVGCRTVRGAERVATPSENTTNRSLGSIPSVAERFEGLSVLLRVRWGIPSAPAAVEDAHILSEMQDAVQVQAPALFFHIAALTHLSRGMAVQMVEHLASRIRDVAHRTHRRQGPTRRHLPLARGRFKPFPPSCSGHTRMDLPRGSPKLPRAWVYPTAANGACACGRRAFHSILRAAGKCSDPRI